MKALKGNLVILLVLALALSSLSFADSTGSGTKGQGIKGTKGEVAVQKTVKTDATEEKAKNGDFLQLFNTYAPEIYDDMVALKEDHIAIHTEIKAIKDQLQAIRDAKKTDKKNLGQEMKAQYAEKIKNKEMTREEAIAAVKEQLASQSGQKLIDENYKAQLEALRDELNANAEAREAVRESIKAALADKANIDAELLNGLLNELADLRVAHNALDEEHLSILEDILAAVQVI